ncbi:MAG TPA: alpha-amylase family glycosyl hydrolase [Kiritimatiellia bacterium]|nr:alpha-amylase family glycosyl hydrolase [Kiritimatiellia bacterium]
MKHPRLKLPRFLLILPAFFLGTTAHANWGIWDAGIFLNANTTNLTYRDAATQFEGVYLGNFVSVENHTLVLKGGEIKTWKNSGGDVTGGTMFYRIYALGSTPGAFTGINLPFFENMPNPGDQKWGIQTLNINVLAGLTQPGTYQIQVYFEAFGTNPTNPPGKFYSNFGNNFTATFDFNIPVLTVNGINANYTTTKFFVDEIRGDSYPVNIVFRPNGSAAIERVEVFSNLNRRDYADSVWTNASGIVTHEGIFPRPGNSIEVGVNDIYFRAYPMQTNIPNVEYSLTLPAEKTGAYRLTARYKIAGNTNWFWYTDTAQGRRDHAIVVSPLISRDIVMYEINTLNIKATSTDFDGRSTFVDLWDGPGSDPWRPGWNLDYITGLGVNWLWFQPIHPYGIDGRHLSAADINARMNNDGANTWRWNGGPPNVPSYDVNYPYALGSPYAVKNFWEIEPRMSKANTRPAAMTEFQDFVAAADDAGVAIMLDAAFNHTSWDVELGDLGVELFATNATPDTEIRNVEARFFSKLNNYAERATSAFDIAPAPDRFDFGKWLDVYDVFFGRYAALVPNDGDSGRYLSEEDWFDYTQTAPGFFDQITQNVWKYFGAYVPYWLERTGHPPGTPPEDHHLGIDGLRCDFGQGLPPQAWEYIINRARSVKWSFVFMAETLDGGPPPYRSNRHFDILNENIVFALQGATSASAYRNILEERRTSFGQGLVLLNTTSHDEKNYTDPWEAYIRYAALSTVDGAPMIFPGQELGISEFFGYDLMEINFGKHIPHFKTYNTMMPAWNDTDFGNLQLYPAYAAVGQARQQSPALRSSNRWFINRKSNGQPYEPIYSVAKYETANASPAISDVVFGFVNLDRNNTRTNTFDVDITVNSANLFGIKPGRTYNAQNIAAFGGIDPNRKFSWLWGGGLSGSDILNNGIFVSLNPVPVTTGGWTNAPYEPLYLKLFDITAPPAPTSTPQHVLGTSFVLDNQATFSWAPVIDPEGLLPRYRVLVNINGNLTTNFTMDTSFTVEADYGDQVSLSIVAQNPHWDVNASGPSPQSPSILLINPNSAVEILDFDQDAIPRDITVSTLPGFLYTIQFSDHPFSDAMIWSPFANLDNGIGTWLETNTNPSTFTFIDDQGPNTTLGPPAQGVRAYRVDGVSP